MSKYLEIEDIIQYINNTYNTNYSLGEPVGVGGFAKVFNIEGYKRGENDTCEYVCKVILKSNADNDDAWAWIQNKIKQEQQILLRSNKEKALDSRYVGTYEKTYSAAGADPEWFFSIQKKLVPLDDYKSKQLGKKPTREAKELLMCKLFSDLSESLEYVHSKNYLIRDIKPGNVMYDDENDRCIICDFNTAREFDENDYWVSKTTQAVGSHEFAPPESPLVICTSCPTDRKPNPRQDVYSLGATIFNRMTRKSLKDPVTGKTEKSDKEKYAALEATNYSKELQNIVFCCIITDPNKRYQTAEELYGYIGTLYKLRLLEQEIIKKESVIQQKVELLSARKDELTAVQSQLKKEESNNKDLNRTIEKLTAEIEEKEALIKNNKIIIQKQREEIARLGNELVEVITEGHTDKGLAKEYLSQVNLLSDQNLMLQAQLSTINDELASIRELREGLDEKNQKLQSNIDLLLKEKRELLDSNNKLEKEKKELESSYEKMAGNYRKVQKDNEKIKRRLKQKSSKSLSTPDVDLDLIEKNGRNAVVIDRSKIENSAETVVCIITVLIASFLFGFIANTIKIIVKNNTATLIGVEFNSWGRQYALWCLMFLLFGVIAYIILKLFDKKQFFSLVFIIALVGLLWPSLLGAPGLINSISFTPSNSFDNTVFVSEGDKVEAVINPPLCKYARLTYSCKGDLLLDNGNKIQQDEEGRYLFPTSVITAKSMFKSGSANFVLDNTDKADENNYITKTLDSTGKYTKYWDYTKTSMRSWNYGAKVEFVDDADKEVILTSMKVEAETADGKQSTIKEWEGEEILENGCISLFSDDEPLSNIIGLKFSFGFKDANNKKIKVVSQLITMY